MKRTPSATMGAAGGSTDALGSLLSDTLVGGLEGSVFGRPKTLRDLKQQQPSTPAVKPGASHGSLSSTPSQAGGTAYLSATAAPPAASAPLRSGSVVRDAPKGTPDPFSLDSLEVLLPKSSTRPMNQTSSRRATVPAEVDAAAAAAGFDAGDLLNASGFATPPAAAAAPAAAPLGSVSDLTGLADDPFSSSSAPPAATSGDPFDIFTSPSAAPPAASAAGAASSHDDDGLLPGFGSSEPAPVRRTEPEWQQPREPPQREQRPLPEELPAHVANGASGADVYEGSRRRQPAADDVPDPFASEPIEPTQLHEQRPQPEQQPAEQRPPRYRVFDYLDDSKPAAPSGRPLKPSQTGMLSAPPPGSGRDKPMETVAEVGHRAAKALQAGSRWLLKKGKAVVREVGTRLEHQRHHASSGGAACEQPGTPPYYYDWAAQLAQLAPDARTAALGTLSEEDRLTVQRILDESSVGDAFMESRYEGYYTEGSTGTAGTAHRSRHSTRGEPSPEQQPAPRSRHSDDGSDAAPPKAPAARPAPPSRAPEPDSHDLLGVGGGAAVAGAARPAPGDDLLGGLGDSHGQHASTSHIEDMFTVQQPSMPAAAAAARPSAVGAKAAPKPSSSSRSALDDMIGLTGEPADVDTAGHDHLYNDAEAAGEEGEPEIRRQLRERRIRQKHERMRQQLADKRARDEADAAEIAGKVALRGEYKPRVDAWAAGKKDNIRALLSTLHVVLWEDSGWVPPSMADMVESAKVKRVYMKANLIVHPDKVKQKGGSLEQIALADMVFDVLKLAWGKFEAAGSK